MHLTGSCSCGAVRFSLESREPVPFMRCYCSICRKTQGGGGFSINLGGDARSLEVGGREHVRVYRAEFPDAQGRLAPSAHERHFCGLCGAHLWAWNAHWPDLVHPLASAIDTPLPPPPHHVHLMLGSKANWVPVEGTAADKHFDEYPDVSLAEWHEKHWQEGEQ